MSAKVDNDRGRKQLDKSTQAQPSFQTQKQAHGWQATEQPITRAN